MTALGKCINALAENSSHVPIRDSKLTRLLRDSFGGELSVSFLNGLLQHYLHLYYILFCSGLQHFGKYFDPQGDNIFAGTARTSLIVTIGPSPRHRGETSSTILFGQRVSSTVCKSRFCSSDKRKELASFIPQWLEAVLVQLHVRSLFSVTI